jgi:hypothetical protein
MIRWYPDADVVQAMLDEDRDYRLDPAPARLTGLLALLAAWVVLGWLALVPHAVHLGELAGRWL